MDCIKIGKLISSLRKERGLTQKNIAEKLNISNKTISKWECGIGCPDVSLWSELSEILGVDIEKILQGDLSPNSIDSGNIKKINFYVCSICKNIITSTSKASISCCGRKLTPLVANHGKELNMKITNMDNDYHICFDHEMNKDHYIMFVSYVIDDKIFLYRLYPEQTAEIRIPEARKGSRIYLYCNCHGLFEYKIFDNYKI